MNTQRKLLLGALILTSEAAAVSALLYPMSALQTFLAAGISCIAAVAAIYLAMSEIDTIAENSIRNDFT